MMNKILEYNEYGVVYKYENEFIKSAHIEQMKNKGYHYREDSFNKLIVNYTKRKNISTW